jgi:hypothetical protein
MILKDICRTSAALFAALLLAACNGNQPHEAESDTSRSQLEDYIISTTRNCYDDKDLSIISKIYFRYRRNCSHVVYENLTRTRDAQFLQTVNQYMNSSAERLHDSKDDC